MKEIWKDIKGFAGKYWVSSKGRIKNKSGIMRLNHNSNGYVYICLYLDGVQYTKRVHRLVAEAFIDNPQNKPFVDHIDTNPSNNVYTNLRWTDATENQHNFTTKLKRYKTWSKYFIEGLPANYVASQYGLNHSIVWHRLKRGWDLKRACTTPRTRRRSSEICKNST